MKLSSKTSSFSFQAIVAACLMVFLVNSGGSSYAQAQEVIFSDVGAVTSDWLGYDVAISGDGIYLAAAAYTGDANGLRSAGYARLYARSGTDWNMIQQINGTRSFGFFSQSLDLSHDGSMLTIGESYGPVYMYELSSSSFLYELVHTTDDIDAWEVSMSGDGMIVGVTSANSSIGSRIYERIGDGFQQRGADISGYGFDSGIALNYDGSIAIVGDRYWPSFTYIGRAAVFQWKDDNEDGSMQWVQMGSDITGDAANDYFGYFGCVSITHDGLTVSVGAEGYDRDGLSDRGLVRMYNHDSISDQWKQSGIDLVGDNAGDYFSRTSLSSDGAYLAVGAWNGNYVKVFAKNGDNYEAVGDTIIGELEGDRFGFSVDMSADASALVVNDFSFESDKGKVYLYHTFLSSSTPAPTASFSLAPSLHESSTPTTSPIFSPSFVTAPASKGPSSSPSKVSSVNPTRDVTNPPSKQASNPPTRKFSTQPSVVRSDEPSAAPITPKPTASPTMEPTTAAPTRLSLNPTSTPSKVEVSASPSDYPSVTPNAAPSMQPTFFASRALSMMPSIRLTVSDSLTPSRNPSVVSSSVPSLVPSTSPFVTLSEAPVVNSSDTPSKKPSVTSSSTPSIKLVEALSVTPSILPSATQTATPSITPIQILSTTPSSSPSNATFQISSVPPSVTPSITPMKETSEVPSFTQVESSTNIVISTTGVSESDVTPNSLTALGAVTRDFFGNATDLTVTEANVVVADVADDGERFLQADDSVTFLFEITTLSLATTPVNLYLVEYLTTNIMIFTDLMRDSDPAFSGLIALQVDSVPSSSPSLSPSLIPSRKPIVGVESGVTSEPTKSPTVSPTISHVPTISFMPTFDPTSSPTSNPTSFPTKMQSDVPSQMPSLTPPVTSIFLVPYERMTNSTTHNLTAVEAVLKEDDESLLEYLSADEALLDEPFEVENVVSQVIDENDADVCFDSTYLCYTINTNVNVTRYPVTYSTDRSELIILSSVLDFMEERDISIVPLVSVPDNVESILSIVFGGVPAKEMNEVEVEAFETTTFDFLFDNLGQMSSPVLVEEVAFLSQSLSQPSTGDDSEEEQAAAELTVNFGVSGEYLPPPEINFDEVLVEVFDEEGQDDYLEVLLASDNEYFNAATNLDIVDIRVVDSVQEDSSSGSIFGLLGDEGGYSIIGVGCAIFLLVVGMLVREKRLRRERTRQRNEVLKTRHLELRRLQNERFGVQDRDYAVVEEVIQNMEINNESSNENVIVDVHIEEVENEN